MRGEQTKARAKRSIFEERSGVKTTLSGDCNGFGQITRMRGQRMKARDKRIIFEGRSGVKTTLLF